ncbi:TetR family transcriptional regulator [Arthrobacter echini]|uniref:TetR family transcriptional regulator n=1 Tax=Arthrobacter echini TaxID=1529066 RepID=A0A4S5EAC4_9MICC|nr:TetR family transcriptional regulator C-terminal domain-containing protein [Arthrobacter echini]THJ68624.1 TetR family transcriptional regulator [Arthrobacter echini]
MPKRIDRDARKAQFAEAVWRIILDRGISAVSIRTVAEQASVAVGSLRHVFPTRAELLRFSAELMLQRARDRILSTEALEDPEQYALEIAKNLLPLHPDSRAELEINIALIAESPALPELVQLRDDAYQQLGQLCVRLVGILAEKLGEQDVREEARRLHALIDGVALHLLMRPLAEDADWAIRIIRGELHRIAHTSG